MQIVINIEETQWDWLRNGFPDEDDGEYAIKAIVNGISLPKRHGRLIDADAFIAKANKDRAHSCYIESWTADDVLDRLQQDYAPTIIEADKG